MAGVSGGGGGGGRVRSTAEEHGPLDRAGGAGDGGQLGHRGGRRAGPGAAWADCRWTGQTETPGQGM